MATKKPHNPCMEKCPLMKMHKKHKMVNTVGRIAGRNVGRIG